ncbi:ATP-binding protein [Clostridium sp. AWRP]|uniref:YifB family Mg chelatase-like AAA ATPase n=1 Tax=Clostridium sp. AWRP TaxID=2212991 RepID=UPI001FA99B44|nr:ATP-binding protein [Clostridium sp. AWRP]
MHSCWAHNKNEGLITRPPFRNPHHTSTTASLIGGGKNLMPGEISLAHNGVLFLDEILEFRKNVLETLRQPLEEKKITINRTYGRVTFPCNFMTVLATNPCPCGNFASKKECNCTEFQRKRYISKLSGPILDRIDLFTFVNSLDFKDIENYSRGEPSKNIKSRVEKARKIQKQRFKNEGIHYNSEMSSKLIRKYCNLDERSLLLIKSIYVKYNLTTRSYSRILKVARTIADLSNSKKIQESHLAEALHYRKFLDDKFL